MKNIVFNIYVKTNETLSIGRPPQGRGPRGPRGLPGQGVVINDKHIEVIIRQMMRWVLITDVGYTPLIVEEKVDKHRFLPHILGGTRPLRSRGCGSGPCRCRRG